jgi:hypothetical protein
MPDRISIALVAAGLILGNALAGLAQPLVRARQRDAAEVPAQLPAGADQLLEGELLKLETRDWIGGGLGTPQAARELFEAQLKSRVDRLNGRYQLSATQQKKLFVAGRGDIKRFFDRVDDLRRRQELAAGDREARLANIQDFISLTKAARRDLFDAQSIFAKTIKSTLTPEQIERFAKLEPEIAQRRHLETIRWVVGTWDETIKLNGVQHAQIEALLVQETRPPRTFGYNDYFGLLLQAARHEEKLKAVFTPAQWTTVSAQLAEARRLETILKDEGYVPEESSVAGTPPGRIREPDKKPQSDRG